MTEVIELLSSSSLPPSPISTKAGPVSRVIKTTLSDELAFGFDDFDETGSLDFNIDRPRKRTRLSPKSSPSSKLQKRNTNTTNTQEVLFNISSDDDTRSDYKSKTITTSFRGSFQGADQPEVVEDITFSSSAPEPLLTAKKRQPAGVDTATKSSLNDFFNDDYPFDGLPVSLSQPTLPDYDHRTENLLAALTKKSCGHEKSRPRVNNSKAAREPENSETLSKAVDDIDFSSPVRTKSSKSAKLTEDEMAARAAERALRRAAVRADKDATRQAEKARKQVEKEEKEKEKQKAADLAEVNKSRTNKKDATPEMILDMSSLLKDTSVGNQVEKRMDNVQVEVNYIDEEFNLTDDDAEQEQYGSLITWRRKVKATYNDDVGQWEPISRSRIVKEKHILVHLLAGDFAAVSAVSRAGSGNRILRSEDEMKANLDAHVSSLRRRFGHCIPVYLIEGLRSWLKKNANAKNRAYTAAVRAQMLQADADAEPVSSKPRVRKRKKPDSDSLDLSHVTSDIVDDLLLHLQLAHQPILIHHTPTPADSASQISALTQHLSTRPYRLAQLDYNLKSASFCMDRGQVRTGDDPKDTFVKMLQEVQRVTPSMALGIVNRYETIRKLVKGFDKHGNLLLEDVRKALNTDGAWSDKRLGAQVSKRLYKVFVGRDPTTTDGMS